MGVSLATRPRAVVAGAIAIAVVLAIAYETRYRWTPQKKKEIHLHTLVGESTILPRVTRSASRGSEVESSLRTVRVVGVERQYLLVAPKVVDHAKSYPLILVFHGDGWNAARFHDAWPLERVTGGDAVLAYADGIEGLSGNAWDLETTKDNREVLFSEAMIKAIEERNTGAKIDHQKLFATGYSSGGFMVNVLACHRPGLLRAIASNAGGAPYNQLERHPNGFPRCPNQQPTPILAMHGEGDHSVTLDSGRFSAEYWAYVNGCSATEMETTGYPECRAYRSCSSNKQAVFCSIGPLGHWIWDEAPSATWTFFQRYL